MREIICSQLGSDQDVHLTKDAAQAIGVPLALPLGMVLAIGADQKRIVAKVEHLMKLCDALEAALRRREDRAAKLAEAVTQEVVA